jgi:hypothetical protein
MAVIDHFSAANAVLARDLGFTVSEKLPGTSGLRIVLKRVGMRRFEHVVESMVIGGFRDKPGSVKYTQLMAMLARVQPAKRPGTKYRNSLSGYGAKVNADMDRQWLDRVAREP